jgi:hypothetical protein
LVKPSPLDYPNPIKYIIAFKRVDGFALRQSMMFPFTPLSADFHSSFKSCIRFQETEIAIPDAVLILREIDQVSNDKPARIGRKFIPPLY